MKPLTPWRSSPNRSPEESSAEILLEKAGRVTPFQQADRDALWRRISHAQESRSPRRAMWWTLAAAGAAAGVAVWQVGLPPKSEQAPVVAHNGLSSTTKISLGSIGSIEVELTTSYRIARSSAPGAEDRIELSDGRLTASVAHRKAQPFVVSTPHLQVRVVGTRFTVAVARNLSHVEVHEGSVEVVAKGGASVQVAAGGSIISNDAALQTPPPQQVESASKVVVPNHTPAHVATVRACAERRGSAKRACYEMFAKGSDLSAQNALYALALIERDEEHQIERALDRLRSYQRRFPKGVLAPEASMGVLTSLLALHQHSDALAESDRYLRLYPSNERIGEVMLIRAHLLREHYDKELALLAYRAIRERPLPRNLHGEALFYQAICEKALGRVDAARTAWQRYLHEYAGGPHAEEARKLLTK